MNAVWFDRSADARLVMVGADAKDLLHRLSTNEVLSLVPGEGRANLLLERSGRLLDRLVVVNRGADLLLLGNAGRGEVLREWIERLIILEDCRVEDVTAATGEILVTGEGATQEVHRATGVDAGALAMYEGAAGGESAPSAFVTRVENHAGPAFRIVVPLEGVASLRACFDSLAAGDDELLSRIRVAAGVPSWGAELDERTIPLEARLVDAISFTKGCYIGQEIIARVHHHKRVKRLLCRLAVEGAEPLAQGSAVFGGGAAIGRVTSSASGTPRSIALAYVETGAETPGTKLEVRDGERSSAAPRAAEVLSLNPEGDPRWPS